MMTSPPRERFAAVVAAGDQCDLARGALEIARIAYPALAPEPYLRQLDALAAAVRPRLAGRGCLDGRGCVEDAVRELTSHLFERCGFHGNTENYYDPRNSFLNDVLERRSGIPISLSVLVIETGARLGLAIEGVGFPGHFLVRVHGANGPLLFDPYLGGRPVDAPEVLTRLRAFYAAGGGSPGENLQRVLPQALQTTTRRGMLWRMLANLLRIYRDRNEGALALATVDLMLVLAPGAPEQLRVRGLLYEQLECFAAARRDLRRYLELVPDGTGAAEARERVARLARVDATVH